MRWDITKLPMDWIVTVVLAAAIAATFLTAFTLTVSQEEAAVQAPTPAAPAAPPAGGAGVEIRAIPTLKFDRTTLEVPANTDVTIRFVNEDTGVPHDFAIWTKKKGEKIAGTEIITGPKEAAITVNLAPGEYYFNCTVHPTQMEGKVVAR